MVIDTPPAIPGGYGSNPGGNKGGIGRGMAYSASYLAINREPPVYEAAIRTATGGDGL